MIVAARHAYGEYLETSAYICQPDRYFREDVTRLGFYADGEIKREIARILYAEESVIFTAEEAERRMSSRHEDVRRVGELIGQSLTSGSRRGGEASKVMLLSPPSDVRTVSLQYPITNDTVAISGRPWAWTLGQRYVSLASVRSGAQVTSALRSPGDEGEDEDSLVRDAAEEV